MPQGDFEVRFGRRAFRGSEGKLSRDEPIEITADGAHLRVSGYIDRLN